MAEMTLVRAAEVRAAIAAHLLGDPDHVSGVGEVRLHPHQREGVERVKQLLERHGGALLADDVGLGKTFVALAIAREARDTLVIAPAAIRHMWLQAAQRACVAVRFLSVEGLGRGNVAAGEPDLVVIDEAHHLRSATTKRFAVATSLCSGAKVLLLSATPVQNKLGDLRTILSLFLGERVHAMSMDELARHVVRRVERDIEHSSSLGLPRVTTPQWVPAIPDVDCLDRLLALPPALPPADGDDAGALLTYTLVRQWSSSRAALRAALQRRVARARAIEDALVEGRLPSRSELSAWCFADGAQQLAFPELTVRAQVASSSMLLDPVRQHACAVRELLAWLEISADPDRARVDALLAIMQRHRGERIVAFSEYADTIAAMYRALAPSVRAAMLTHGGGRVIGGAVSRSQLLTRFGPGSAGRTRPSDRIDILLTTDVLSEGVSLQDASVVVHLDLSWNPARLEQRVGRLRRMGAARDSIAVYMFAPPAPAERLLQLQRRLRLKLGAAAAAIGVAGAILPGIEATEPGNASAQVEETILSAVRKWRCASSLPPGTLAAAVRSSTNGALACVRCEGVGSLVAVIGDRVTDAPAAVARLTGCAAGDDARVEVVELRAIRGRVENWLRRRVVSDVVHLPTLHLARSRRALLHRVETISRRASRHAEPELAPLMRAARTAATATLSAGAERVLHELARASLPDEAWLHAIGEFAALHARDNGSAAPELLALLLLRAT